MNKIHLGRIGASCLGQVWNIWSGLVRGGIQENRAPTCLIDVRLGSPYVGLGNGLQIREAFVSALPVAVNSVKTGPTTKTIWLWMSGLGLLSCVDDDADHWSYGPFTAQPHENKISGSGSSVQCTWYPPSASIVISELSIVNLYRCRCVVSNFASLKIYVQSSTTAYTYNNILY